MKIKSIVCLALLCCVCLTSLTGCGLLVIRRTGTEEQTAGTHPQATAAATLPDVDAPQYNVTDVEFPTSREESRKKLEAVYRLNLSGVDFMIASAAEAPRVLFPEASDLPGAARKERNAMISERFGCGFIPFSSSVSELRRNLSAAIGSGVTDGFYADLLLLPEEYAASFMNGGLLMNLRTLPFYTVKDTGAGANYMDISSATDDCEGIYVLYFNRTLLGKEVTAALYEAALGDVLTWEYFFRLVSETGGKVSFGGAADASADLNIADEIASVRMGNADAAQTLRTLIGAADKNAALGVFGAGKSAFHLGVLADAAELYKIRTAEWGIVPLPGGSAAQNLSRRGRPVLCVPANNVRIEETGILLCALEAASGAWIRGEYAKILAENYLRDNASCLTVKKILGAETHRSTDGIFAGEN